MRIGKNADGGRIEKRFTMLTGSGVHAKVSTIAHVCKEEEKVALPVTIKDIAKEAKVSHTTVSRALRGHPAIATDTASRIQRLADELGYVPNTVARSLKMKRSQVLGVIVRRITDPFFAEVLHGIEDVLQDEGYSLFLAASHRDPGREREIIRLMSERRVDGVIICSTEVDTSHGAYLKRFNVPSVLINNQAQEDITYSVYHDDVEGSRQLTQHLINLGHHHIAYLGNGNAGRTNEDRRIGCRQALIEAQIPIEQSFFVDSPNGMPEGGAMIAEKLVALSPRPTAIVCFNDMVAVGTIRALQQANLRVPEDCSVVGFDNIDLSAYVNPPLTTFDQPKYELGRQAAQMMLQVLNDESGLDPAGSTIILQGRLIERQSTAVVNSGS